MLNTITAILDAGAGGGGGAYESIATLTASGGETSLTFNSIPSTYKHLQIRGIYRDTYTANTFALGVTLQFNSDTGSNYSRHSLIGDGSAASAQGSASQTYIQVSNAGYSGTNPIFGASITDIIDYASTTKNKTVRAFSGADGNSATYPQVGLDSGAWLSTSAITSIKINKGLTAFAAGTTFALYGIKGA